MKIDKDTLILAQVLGGGGGITPTGNQDISTLAEYDVSTKATARVSAEERAKIIPENIKNGVTVFGVAGSAPVMQSKTVEIELSSPYNASYFQDCLIQESVDYSTWTNIGAIYSVTGKTTVTMSANANYMRLILRGEAPKPSLIKDDYYFNPYSTGGLTEIMGGGNRGYIDMAIVGSGAVRIYHIDWDDE